MTRDRRQRVLAVALLLTAAAADFRSAAAPVVDDMLPRLG